MKFLLIILLVIFLSSCRMTHGYKNYMKTTFPTDISFDEMRTMLGDKVNVGDLDSLLQPGIFEQDLREDLRNMLKDFIDQLDLNVTACSLCKKMTILLTLLDKNMTDSQLENLIVRGCQVLLKPFGYKVDPMCNTVKHQLPSIMYVLNKLVNPAAICPYLNACIEKNLKTKKIGKKQINENYGSKKSNKTDPLRIIHLTDIHIEPNYAPGSNTDCGLPVCCLETQGKGNAGIYGDYNCNIPLKTVALFLENVKQLNPDFVIFSGDIPPHTLWEETYESQVDCMRSLTSTIQSTLPNITVYPILGNHEFYPTNLFSVKNQNYSKPFLEEFITSWKTIGNFSTDDEVNIRKGGFYSKRLTDRLRLISFNTNYMYTMNFYNVLNDGKPNSSETSVLINFLITNLDEARSRNEKVILIFHHPPGNHDFIVSLSKRFEEILLNYSQIIVLMPVGHTHYDEFKMLYDVEGSAKGVILVSPSLTTKSVRNPSFRQYDLDADDHSLLDYHHFYLDLNTASNVTNVNSIKKLYSAKEEYQLDDLSPDSWSQLLEKFATNDDLFLKHLRHSQADATSAEDADCAGKCKDKYICRMLNFNFDEYLNCVDSAQPPTSPAPPPDDNAAYRSTISYVVGVFACLVVYLL